MSNNNYTDLGLGIFNNLTSLRTLDLARNKISHIEARAFEGLGQLIRLDLSYNRIMEIGRYVFSHMPSLKLLELGYNLIAYIPAGTFEYLTEITDLILRRNNLSRIEPGAFKGLDKITGISFTGNGISELRKGTLDGLSAVEWISFRQNPLSYIEPGTFENTTQIQYLLLAESALTNLEPNMFKGIENLKSLSTDDYRLCCLFDNADVCTVAQRSSLDSCTRLMPNLVLRVAMWILGFGALIGNSMVLVIRLRGRRGRGSKEQPFFITNLAVADWIMGVFMIIIASADIYYGEYYFLYAPIWRDSALCSFAGFLAIMSSESSVFLLTVITLDRLTSILCPFSRFRFGSKSSAVFVGILWIVTLVFGLLPILIGTVVPNFYGLSDVCIGLPLSLANTQTGQLVWSHELALTIFQVSDEGYVQPSWVYSIALFLVVNLICFMFILISYVVIFIWVKRSAKRVGGARHSNAAQDQEIRMAAKMALIVGTDFCCWMPVIIMGILSQTGLVTLPVTLYAWCAVFILPINASLNPYLYTIVAYIGRRKKRKNVEASSFTCSTIAGTTITEKSTKM